MTKRQEIDLNYIKDRIEFYTGLDVRTDTRKRDYVYARMVFCKIMREEFLINLATIGEYLGRSHCSVIYAISNFDIIENYEKGFYKVYQYILLEMESEQIFIGKKHMGDKKDIDRDVLRVREALKQTIESLQIIDN